ncbi:small-conductance mechanosensitive channel [Cyanobium sp. Copco_Reservoir_LC18]|uniref:mechanosensitive ion channel family protein n=1 Tax=Cyanobium sp. Copco_Reservoir_LC18 TaxID=1328305 RepID=UPI001359ACD4|nr:mechanosensitive ion channel domain-containing protein [Cyanobium sp. Copco_Reservoir_LC18]KAF0654475.1 small-conductance mechanosensitive channel [Cyanobium sp. Copco_Reservoir_LC18]
MNDLLGQMVGWLPMLGRPQVLVQLALVALAVAGGRLAGHRFGPNGRPGALELGTTAALAAVGWGLLAIVRLPTALAILLITVVVGLQVSELVLRRAERWLPEDQIQPLRHLLIRPFLLAGLLWALIEELDTRAELALIPLGRWMGANVNVGDVTRLVVVLYLLLVASGPPSLGVAWLLKRLFALERVSARAIGLMVRYAVISLGTVALLETIGFNSTALLAIAGGLSVGLGFGIKEVFGNFVSGLWLLFEGSLRPGDIIALDGDFCEVRRLGLRATRLWRDRDNAELVIPNQTFFNSSTVEFSVGRTRFLTQIAICIDAGQPATTILALLEEIAAGVPGVESHPPPRAYVQGVGDRGGDYVLKFWIHSPFANRMLCSAVMAAAIERFRELGISLPFPRLIVERARTEPPGESSS